MGYWRMVAPIWDEVSIYDGPEVFQRGFAAAPRRARNLMVAHWCVSEVRNGGLGQFFSNSTGVIAPEAAEAFSEMGMFDAARVLREAMGIFGEPYPRDRREREALLEAKCSDSTIGLFSRYDVIFEELIDLDVGGWDQTADAYADASN